MPVYIFNRLSIFSLGCICLYFFARFLYILRILICYMEQVIFFTHHLILLRRFHCCVSLRSYSQTGLLLRLRAFHAQAQCSWVQPSSPAARSPHEEFLHGFRSWNTPADRRGRSQRALSERRKVQPVMQPGRGPDCKGAWTGGWGCASGSQRQGNSREGTHFRIRTGHSALHTCPLRIHLSPRPDVLPSVCLPPAPETSQGPESTSCYVGLISPLSHMLASPECSLAIGTTARFIPLSPSTKHT